jgi:hypothetical protein
MAILATRRTAMSPLATDRRGRPIPVVVALREMVVMLLMRNTAAVFLAPRPIVRRAFLAMWSFVVVRRTAPRKTATLLLKPASPRNLQSPVANIERNKAYQNSFFLQLDGPGWLG